MLLAMSWPNWSALLAAAAGAVVGGAGAAIAQGARNRPMGDAALVGASLGAIIGASLAPRKAAA